MKTLLVGGLAVAGLVAVVVVPTAAAAAKSKSASVVKLSTLPLPASAIGAAATSLPLERAGSGVLVNGTGNLVGKLVVGEGLSVAPNHAFPPFGPSGSYLEGLGRISGYALDYGLGASGGAGVTEVRTTVDEWRTRADAKKGLSVWEAADRQVTNPQYMGDGFSITLRPAFAKRAGSRRFAFLVGYSAANIAPLFGVDEQFTRGRYEADVTVWAGTAAAAAKLAPELANKLDRRIKRALAGRLHATPVKLPPKQKPGRAGGPDLSALALQTTDLSGNVTQLAHDYRVGDPLSAFTVSGFWADFIPAGQYSFLSQEIQWFATPNQASFEADLDATFFDQASPLDLSGVGDGAVGVLVNAGGRGIAEVVFLSGQLEEIIDFASNSAIQASDAEAIAQTVADYINTAGLGS